MSELFTAQFTETGNSISVAPNPGTERRAAHPQGNIAIIGGTGFEELPPEIYAVPIDIETPFGTARVLSLSDNYVEPHKLYFLPRHGAMHGLAPHEINYLANTAALVALGVTHILATNAVGSLRLNLPPGTLITFDDFIDFTRSRPLTYFAHSLSTHSTDNHTGSIVSNPTDPIWKHVDFSVPYSQIVREAILRAGQEMGMEIVPNGTYVCCDGPRFESPAEVRLFARWGGDVVGMTGLPEAIFAREAGLEYAAIGIVTNFGAGLTKELVDHAAVTRQMSEQLPRLRELLLCAAGKVVALTADLDSGLDSGS